MTALVNPYAFAAAGGPVTSYANAGGTGDRTASITISTNDVLTSGTINNLIDGAKTAVAADAIQFGSSTDKLKYILLDFGSAQCIDAFKSFQDASAGHGSWRWGGSNDQAHWTDFGNFTLDGSPTGLEFPFTNTGGYRYYILWQEPGVGMQPSRWFEELEFKIAAASAAANNTSNPSYLNKFGFLDRSLIWTITSTATTGGGTLDNLVDGNAGANSTDAWFFTNGQSGKEIKFDAGAGNAPRITEVTWYQDSAGAHGTWKWQYSDNDSTYTDIGSSFTLGGAVLTTHDLSANASGHRYYKLVQVSGTTSSSPWILEVLFKAAHA